MRVLLADHHRQVRWALRTAIGEEPGLTVVSEVEDVSALLSQTQTLHPDLILLEWELPGEWDYDLLVRVQALEPQSRVIVLSNEPECKASALAAGADAFVSKAGPPEELLAILRRLVAEDNEAGTD